MLATYLMDATACNNMCFADVQHQGVKTQQRMVNSHNSSQLQCVSWIVISVSVSEQRFSTMQDRCLSVSLRKSPASRPPHASSHQNTHCTCTNSLSLLESLTPPAATPPPLLRPREVRAARLEAAAAPRASQSHSPHPHHP